MSKDIKEMLKVQGMVEFDEDFDINRIHQYTKVFLNGDWIGFIENAK